MGDQLNLTRRNSGQLSTGELRIPVADEHAQTANANNEPPKTLEEKVLAMIRNGWEFLKSERAGEEALRTMIAVFIFGSITSMMMITQMASDRWFDTYTKSLILKTANMTNLAVFRKEFATDPLHDLSFDWLPDWSHLRGWFPDLCLTTLIGSTVFFNILWPHRKRIEYQGVVVLRRFLWILCILYLFRSLTIIVTTVPNPVFNCVPKHEHAKDFGNYVRMIRSMASGKISACTDNIYSGHTSMATLMVYTFWMYSGLWFLKVYAVIHGFVIIWSILITRLHYSIDVLIAMFMTSFVFLTFHFLLTITLDDTLLGDEIDKKRLEGLAGTRKVLVNERRLLHRVYTGAVNRAVWWLDGFDLRLKDHIPKDDDSTIGEMCSVADLDDIAV